MQKVFEIGLFPIEPNWHFLFIFCPLTRTFQIPHRSEDLKAEPETEDMLL